MTMTAHHLYLLAPGGSAEEVRHFYRDALGLEEIPVPNSLAGVSVLWFSAGTVLLHIGYPPTGVVGEGHTALTTNDLDATRARLTALGYAVDDNVIPMGYPRFYARDSWGNQFEILAQT